MSKVARVLLVAGLAVLVAGTACRPRQAKQGEDFGTAFGEEEMMLPMEPPSLEEFEEPADTSVYEDIHFDLDRSYIRPDAVPVLRRIAADMKSNRRQSLLIEGHCDERGSNEYNQALGERRALKTRDFLINLGVDPERIITISYGEEEPLDPRHTNEAWDKNRRAHFKIKP